jgi:hypothetical protein
MASEETCRRLGCSEASLRPSELFTRLKKTVNKLPRITRHLAVEIASATPTKSPSYVGRDASPHIGDHHNLPANREELAPFNTKAMSGNILNGHFECQSAETHHHGRNTDLLAIGPG